MAVETAVYHAFFTYRTVDRLVFWRPDYELVVEEIEDLSKPLGALRDGIESSISSPSELGMTFNCPVRADLDFSFFRFEGGSCALLETGGREGPGVVGELLQDDESVLLRFREVLLSDCCCSYVLYSSLRLIRFKIYGLSS